MISAGKRYIIVIAAFLMAALFIFIGRYNSVKPFAPAVEMPAAPPGPAPAVGKKIPLKAAHPSRIYEIDEIKKRLGEVPGKGPAAGEEGYEDDMDKREWAKVDPVIKADVISKLDGIIEASARALEINPKDKTAKRLLAVSESLKKLQMKEFGMLPSSPQASPRARESSRR